MGAHRGRLIGRHGRVIQRALHRTVRRKSHRRRRPTHPAPAGSEYAPPFTNSSFVLGRPPFSVATVVRDFHLLRFGAALLELPLKHGVMSNCASASSRSRLSSALNPLSRAR
jgi:hypothetical protein